MAWLCVGLVELGLPLLSVTLPSPAASGAAGGWVHVLDGACAACGTALQRQLWRNRSGQQRTMSVLAGGVTAVASPAV